jgi:Domain of unknown function (DUF5615)
MDVHVPYAVTTELQLRGLDVLTAQEDGTSRLEDARLLDRATALGRVLVTQDTGFLREAARRQGRGEGFAGIIYVPSAKDEAHAVGAASRFIRSQWQR